MVNVIYGIIALSLLIVVHEFGHYLVARIADIKVLTFSLGFGKRLIGFKRGETEYAISAIPLGGYVKLLGESSDDVISEKDAPRAYSNKPPFVKILVAFAGPFFNIILAFVLFYFIFVAGYTVLSTKVGSVDKAYPAYQAGIREGDIIVSINGKKISEWSELMEIMSGTEGGPLKVTVNRDGKLIDFRITPMEIEGKNIFGETIKRRVIGITASSELVNKREGPISALSKAIYQTYYLSKITIVGIVKLVEGSISPKQIGGPLLILEVAGKQAKEGKKNLCFFVAIISINLAIINLLPIPILDGGHILFNLIEIIIRRRVPDGVVAAAQKVGIGILVAIMMLAFFNDIMRMFFGK